MSNHVIITALLLLAGITGASAQNKYDDGRCYVYLRGDFTQWAASADYRFERDGDRFSITIPRENPIPAGSKFKIGDSEWEQFDYGGSHSDIYIDADDFFNPASLSPRGQNLRNSEPWWGTIAFTYPSDLNAKLAVSFDNPDRVALSYPSGTLPVMYINVYTDEAHTALDNEVIDRNLNHKDYFKYAEYWLDVNGCQWLIDLGAENVGSAEKPLALQIKARGNYTRTGFSKKPFKLKLDKKQNLLGLTPDKSKHYALLAHADDNKGYLRNFTMFNLGHRIGLPWTPWQQPLEVFINGDYRGLYFLTESIRVGDGRIDINELADNEDDPALISGGYVVELDNYDEQNQINMQEKTCVGGHNIDRLRITYDTPEAYSDLQKRFVTDQFNAMNDAIGSNSDETWRYLDLDDAARYYIVNEIISHTEAYHGSTYLFRDRGQHRKWHFSPLWDGGNAYNGKTDQFFYDCDPFGNTWIPSLRANARFNGKVRETWLWFMSNQFEGLYDDIDDYVATLATAAQYDRRRWKDEPRPDSGNGTSVADNSDINSRKNEVLGHLSSKIEWLRQRLGDYTATTFTEPERDTTEAAPLPEYAVSAIQLPWIDECDGPAEYYDLRGYRVANPEKGRVYIVIKGNRTYKTLVK